MTTLAGRVGLAPKNSGRRVRTGPWSSREFAAIVAGNALAILLATVGWWYTSDEPRAEEQIGWLNLSLAGVVVAIGVNTVFLARGRQTIRVATTVVLAEAPSPGSVMSPTLSANGHGRSEPFMPASSGSANGHLRQDRLVSVAGTQRYHSPTCALVTGKAVEQNTAEAFFATGRHPCEVCAP